MLNNPNSGIRTDFQTDDVFTTTNANQLARAIHYDFVITQEKLDNWVSENATYLATTPRVSVADLIAANLDGTVGSTWATVVAPLSIFIDARLDSAYSFNFNTLFGDVTLSTSSSVPFMDWSDFQVNGTFDSTATDGVVNVYSAYLYRSYMVSGGINFWSTSQAPVTIVGGLSNVGICRVGVYKTETSIDLGGRNDSQLILTRCASGARIAISPSVGQVESDGYSVPCAYYADWMSGGGITHEYTISSTDTSKPGLFQQLVYTVDAGTIPVLTVSRGNSTARYTLTEQGTEKWRFSNTSEALIVTVYKNGDIAWESSAIAGSAGKKVVIYDTDISELPSYGNAAEGLKSMLSGNCGASVSVFRTGGTAFATIAADTGVSGLEWYQATAASGSAWDTFKFKDATTLDWYLWVAVSDYDSSVGAIKWYNNSHNVLYVDTETLTEGVVYEINVHVIELPFTAFSRDSSGSTPDCWVQGNPANTPLTPSGYSATRPCVRFCASSAYSTSVRYWNTSNVVPDNPDIVYPSFTFTDLSDNGYSYTNAPLTRPATSFIDIATAKLPFVKLGGYIYLMSY